MTSFSLKKRKKWNREILHKTKGQSKWIWIMCNQMRANEIRFKLKLNWLRILFSSAFNALMKPRWRHWFLRMHYKIPTATYRRPTQFFYLNDALAGNYALQLYLAQNQSWINKCFPKQVEEVETYATSRPARYRLLTYVLSMNVFHFGQFDMLWARKCLFTMIFTIVMLTLAWSKMTKQTGDYQLIDKRLLDQSSVSRLAIWPILIACLFSYA